MKTQPSKLSLLSKLLLIGSALLLVVAIFVPIWRIELDAPQYPEGLVLLIFANKLGGNADIINGLNHYIGMKTLHAEDFLEFTVLPYCIGFFALLSVVVMITGRKKFLYVLMSAFILFGIVAVADFWRWEYNYGHNLDPNAAIIVPGMAYQPPLIGFKQLLNFGAFSVPDLGGWLFIASGLLMLIAVIKESNFLIRFKKKKRVALSMFLFPLLFCSCSDSKPEPIQLNKDNCDYCKMTISSPQFACELLTSKGRAYKFDDAACMINYKRENTGLAKSIFYVSDYLAPYQLLRADSLYYIFGENVGSPMGGNIAGFSNADSAKVYIGKLMAMPTAWSTLIQ